MVWLAEPGDDPPVPAGAKLLRGSADLPGAHLLDLVATMDRLRVECPWDARQTHQSLAPHLLEEPYEALDALESGDEQAFCEELGDVLLQVVFHARVAAERDDGTGYTIDDVADGIVAKLVRRHPHVFADVTVSGADEVYRNWDEIKRAEKRERAERAGVPADADGPPSALDGVPFGQPALALAAQLQRRAARAGVDLARLTRPDGEDIGRELFRLVTRAHRWASSPRRTCAPPPAGTATSCARGRDPRHAPGRQAVRSPRVAGPSQAWWKITATEHQSVGKSRAAGGSRVPVAPDILAGSMFAFLAEHQA